MTVSYEVFVMCTR